MILKRYFTYFVAPGFFGQTIRYSQRAVAFIVAVVNSDLCQACCMPEKRRKLFPLRSADSMFSLSWQNMATAWCLQSCVSSTLMLNRLMYWLKHLCLLSDISFGSIMLNESWHSQHCTSITLVETDYEKWSKEANGMKTLLLICCSPQKSCNDRLIID